MVRKIAGLLVLLFVAGLPVAAQDAKDAKKVNYTTVFGYFESYKKEILTLKVQNKEKEFKLDKDFKVPRDTDVGYATPKKQSKVLKAKVHLKDVKKGSAVSVTIDNDTKKVLAVGVLVSELPEDNPKDGEKEEK